MTTILMYVAALLPVFALLTYVYWKDPNKEPFWQVIKAFLWGMAICMPVAMVELAVSYGLFGDNLTPVSLFGTTMRAFFVAALPEEAAKLLALWIVLHKNSHFDETFDGIVYAVCVGLGFAAVENISYVVGAENWTTVAIMRAVLAVPGHYAFAIMMGYYYSVFHFIDHSAKKGFCVLFVPFMAHGVYDSLAMSGMADPLIGGIAFFVLIFFCIKMQKQAHRRIIELVRNSR